MFPWSNEVHVDRRFWESLVCLDPTKQGWLMDEVRLIHIVSVYLIIIIFFNFF